MFSRQAAPSQPPLGPFVDSRPEDSQFLQALLDFSTTNPLALLDSFESIIADKYEELAKKSGSASANATSMTQPELSLIKQELDLWGLINMMSRNRKNKEEQMLKEEAMAVPCNLDDQMVLAYVIEKDQTLKETLLMIKWLEKIYKPGPTNIVAAGELDLNGKVVNKMDFIKGEPKDKKHHDKSKATKQKIHEDGDDDDDDDDDAQVKDNDAENDETSNQSSRPAGSSKTSSADEDLSRQVWQLVRGGKWKTACEVLRKSGQHARIAILKPMILSSFFTDPSFLDPSHPSPLEYLRQYILEDVDHIAGAAQLEEGAAAGVIHRHLLKAAAAAAVALPSASNASKDKSKMDTEVKDQEAGGGPGQASSLLDMNIYERALYAVHGGQLEVVLQVCETWEDVVWAHLKVWAGWRLEQHSSKYPLAWASNLPSVSFSLFHPRQQQQNPSSYVNQDESNNNNNAGDEQVDDEGGEMEQDLLKAIQSALSPARTTSTTNNSTYIPYLNSLSKTSLANLQQSPFVAGWTTTGENFGQIDNNATSSSPHHASTQSLQKAHLSELFTGLKGSKVPVRVKQQASQAFRVIAANVMQGHIDSLLSSLSDLACGPINAQPTSTNGNPTSSLNTTSSSPSFLRFAVHVLLALESLHPDLYSPAPSSQTPSSIVQNATRLLSKYVEYLIGNDKRELVAQYCARMPPSTASVGIDLYVQYMRRIQTTKEREKALELAYKAGLNAPYIASLLVEDVIRSPSSSSHPNSSTHHPTATSTPLRRTMSPMAGKKVGQLTRDSNNTTKEYATPSGVPASRWHLSNNNPTSSIGQGRDVNVGSRPAAIVATSLLQRTSTDLQTHLAGVDNLSTLSVSNEDRERIHALEWLALENDESGPQKFKCLLHANALARAFLLRRHIPAALLLFSNVNVLLSSLFEQFASQLDINDLTADHDNDMDYETTINNEDLETLLSNPSNPSRIRFQRTALREYVCLSKYVESLELYRQWKTKKAEEDRMISKGIHGTTSRTHSSPTVQSPSLEQFTQDTLSLFHQVAFFPHGWLEDGTVTGEARRTEGNFTIKDASSSPFFSSRSSQLISLKRLCLPEVIILTQDVLLASERYHECIRLADELASEDRGLYKHFSSRDIQLFLLNVRASSLKILEIREHEASQMTQEGAVLEAAADPLGFPSSPFQLPIQS